jgi:hypothetical protein
MPTHSVEDRFGPSDLRQQWLRARLSARRMGRGPATAAFAPMRCRRARPVEGTAQGSVAASARAAAGLSALAPDSAERDRARDMSTRRGVSTSHDGDRRGGAVCSRLSRATRRVRYRANLRARYAAQLRAVSAEAAALTRGYGVDDLCGTPSAPPSSVAVTTSSSSPNSWVTPVSRPRGRTACPTTPTANAPSTASPPTADQRPGGPTRRPTAGFQRIQVGPQDLPDLPRVLEMGLPTLAVGLHA